MKIILYHNLLVASLFASFILFTWRNDKIHLFKIIVFRQPDRVHDPEDDKEPVDAAGQGHKGWEPDVERQFGPPLHDLVRSGVRLHLSLHQPGWEGANIQSF